MQAMLLAAGLGTRLRPLTDLRPKPIVPVANRPLASFAMEHLRRCGVDHLVANTHPQPELVERTLQSACPDGIELVFSREAELLGTGGGLRRAQSGFADRDSPVIVVNGDTLFAPDLRAALEAHLETQAVATMILRRTSDPERFGAIGIDGAGMVRSLLGTPVSANVTERLMFTGVHILSPEAFGAMPESGCVIRTAYRHWVDRGAPILGIVDDAPWADLGTVREYHRVNLALAAGTLAWPTLHPRDGSIGGIATTDTDRVRDCVLGEKVRLATDVTLERCVVWDGTEVTVSARDAVITPVHHVRVDV